MFPGDAVRRFEDPAQFSYKMMPGVENIPTWARNWLAMFRGLHPDPLSFVSGNGIYRVTVWEPQKRVVMFKSTLPSLVRISTFYYPGWEAELDGKITRIGIEDGSGAMLIDIPPGNHVLKLAFGETILRVFSRYVSYGSFIILLVVALFSRRKELRQEEKYKIICPCR